MSLCSVLLVENEDNTVSGIFCRTSLNQHFIFDFFNTFFEYSDVKMIFITLKYFPSCDWLNKEYVFENAEGTNLKAIMEIVDKTLPPSKQKYIYIFRNNLWHNGIYNNDVGDINFSIYAKHQKTVKISKQYTKKALKELIKQQKNDFFRKHKL